ncbi:Fructose-bisphosphate aldolase 1, chloroplastic [Tetrabaena socialis]|uniref:fructose-bisphosphate aldolase n=1 Tax=Tetrabaena socialis TaxID=47790 RepID=A0A2J7ZQR2_9CHLO|nr:Fructose-bisphosphate aldolase 1, chloroplastic [Tetrabaena socialis]|eukprot:PNH02601.1 Fructose-bisphosphate aldolase 1, chloroplastic [Tetrabaena socialis]
MAMLQKSAVKAFPAARASRKTVVVRAGKYDEELIKTAHTIASKGRGILAMDESNGTCGKRLDSIGVENTEENRRGYRELLVTAPGLGQYISGAILFEETLYQSTKAGKKFVDVMTDENIVPGIKVDKGLVPLSNTAGESWCMGLDGLDQRCAEYYKAGARFAKWRSVVSVAHGPSLIALRDCAYGLARYAAIAQNAGLVPIVEPEVLLDVRMLWLCAPSYA